MANSINARSKKTTSAQEILTTEKKARANNPSKERHGSKLTRHLAKFSFALAAIALIIAFYVGFTNLTSQQKFSQQAALLTANIEQLKQQLATNTNDFTNSTKQANQLQIQLQSQLTALTENLQSTLHQQAYQKHDWLLLKARYYLELAQINAHWSQDTETTIALLQQADLILKAIPDQQLFSVRQAIAKDIAALNALPKIDRAGLLSQLDATKELISTLPLKLPFIAMGSSDKNTHGSWQAELKHNMNLLKNLIVIRRNDANSTTLLSPLSHRLLSESIQLNLQQAQEAILQNDAQIYQITIAQAIKSIEKAFDGNAQVTQSVIKQLKVLQEVKLESAKPIVDESLPLLNQIIAARVSQPIIPAIPEGEKAK